MIISSPIAIVIAGITPTIIATPSIVVISITVSGIPGIVITPGTVTPWIVIERMVVVKTVPSVTILWIVETVVIVWAHP